MAYKSISFKQSATGIKLRYNEFSIKKNPNGYIHFSSSFSEELSGKGYTKIDFRQDDITGKVGFWFNKKDGLSLTGGYTPHTKNLCCNNKSAVVWLFDTLGIDGERATLRMSDNLSIHPDGEFYEIIGRVK